MIDYYLIAADAAELRAALLAAGVANLLEGQLYPGPGTAIDMIGEHLERTGGTDEAPTFTKVAGYHANIRTAHPVTWPEGLYSGLPTAPWRSWGDSSPLPDAAPADWPAAIAAQRYKEEVRGIVIDGRPIDTQRDSQGLITGAAVQAMLDPGCSLRWKTSAGFVDLNAQQIIAVASAVRAHVQACFDREADLLEAFNNGAITMQMLSVGWPA